MYDDMTKMIESRNDIEKKLSSLESQAAAILGKVMKALSDKQPDVILLRKEVNVLRKFLFVMKYRGPQYYAKYFTGGTQSYNHIDKHLVEGFMLKKSISSPRKVWLHNLLTILDLKMDVKGEWMTAILESMFPADAHMFIYHMRTYYMAFCVPATVDDEFVLTAGAYNVMEGPTNEARDGDTGEYRPQSFISWHEFGVVAPGLLIVLRNNLLPAPLEDANEVVKKLRQSLREAAIQMMPGIGDKESILEDLPAAKALCSTNIVVDGVLQLSPGKDGEMQPKNEFCFKFWPIQTKHLDIINAIFLDNIKDLAGIVFSSKYSFQRTLEAYMLDETNNFKQIYLDEPEGNKSRATCLRKLEEVLTLLGSSITPVYHNAPGRSESVLSCLDKIWIQMMAKLCDNTGTADAKSAHAAFWNTYRSLGGSKDSFLEDLEQSLRWCDFYAKINRLLATESQALRHQATMNMFGLMVCQQPKRVWLYTKHWRWDNSKEYADVMKDCIGIASILEAKTGFFFRPAQEDTIVKDNITLMSDTLLCGLMIKSAITSVME